MKDVIISGIKVTIKYIVYAVAWTVVAIVIYFFLPAAILAVMGEKEMLKDIDLWALEIAGVVGTIIWLYQAIIWTIQLINAIS